MILILLVRGPHTTQYRWFGYEGGMQWWKVQEKANHPPSNNSEVDTQETAKDAPLGDEEKWLPTEEPRIKQTEHHLQLPVIRL